MASETSTTGLARRELIGLLLGVPLVIIAIILAKPLVARVLNDILHLNSTLVYVVVTALVFSEAAIFVGFVFPGETAVILGGVIASTGRVNVVALAALVVLGAILGDTVGYWVGHRYGERLLGIKLLAGRRGAIDSALEMLARRGSLAVFLSRFTAFLRAVMPGLAGVSRMHYRRFFVANALGGIVWGIGFTLAGYFLGNAYQKAEKYASWASTGILIFIVLVAVGLFIRSRRKEHSVEEAFDAATTSPEETLAHEIDVARRSVADDDR